jgi:GT2 family glycosyltransferase
MVARDLSHLTMKAIVSALRQDIGNVRVFLVNQGSTDGLAQAAEALYPDVVTTHHHPPLPSLAAAWNLGLSHLLEGDGGKVLVINNDIELIPETYRLLAADKEGFVTAVGVTPTPEKPFDPKLGDLTKSRPHPDFSCFLIRRWVWEKVGPFDERYLIAYCEDASYHVRMHRAGVGAKCIDIPFLHHAAATINSLTVWERGKVEKQADLNRALFKREYGCEVGSDAYYKLFEVEQ